MAIGTEKRLTRRYYFCLNDNIMTSEDYLNTGFGRVLWLITIYKLQSLPIAGSASRDLAGKAHLILALSFINHSG